MFYVCMLWLLSCKVMFGVWMILMTGVSMLCYVFFCALSWFECYAMIGACLMLLFVLCHVRCMDAVLFCYSFFL